ncbi:MAG: hypothetical protein Q4D82_00235 [Neisseria sp.]|nr:hypothetical protein [Neisseria sp.]
MSSYALAHIVHLFCALVFVGGVFFEALVLSALHKGTLPKEVRRQAEQTVARRAAKVMPFVVLGVFVSGITMAVVRWLPVLADPSASAFGIQLALKILLACGVLLHFVIAVTKIRKGTMNKAWSRYIHTAVLVQMILIVLLAKTMFYLG